MCLIEKDIDKKAISRVLHQTPNFLIQYGDGDVGVTFLPFDKLDIFDELSEDEQQLLLDIKLKANFVLLVDWCIVDLIQEYLGKPLTDELITKLDYEIEKELDDYQDTLPICDTIQERVLLELLNPNILSQRRFLND